MELNRKHLYNRSALMSPKRTKLPEGSQQIINCRKDNEMEASIWYAPVEKDGSIFENKIAEVGTDHVWSEDELKKWFVNWLSKRQEPADMYSLTAFFYDDEEENEVGICETYIGKEGRL